MNTINSWKLRYASIQIWQETVDDWEKTNFHFNLHHINTRIYATQNNLSNLMVKKESEEIEMDVGETAPTVFSWDKFFDSIIAKGIRDS